MKKYAFLLCFAFICLNFTVIFAQSRRVPPFSESGPEKANKREAKPAENPTPQPDDSQTSETQFEQPALDANDKDVIRVDTELVTIPIKIMDKKGRFVSGLTKQNFTVFEDNMQQEIAHFSNEQQPFTVALILDMSYSSTFKIEQIQAAALDFISQLREKDRVMVVSFDQDVHLLCEPTNDRRALTLAIKSTRISSGTSLYDAVSLVINDRFKQIDGRKAIVLFTDGVDTTSEKAHDLNNLSDALELDALVYPIQYDTFQDVQAMKDKTVIMPPTQRSPVPSKDQSPFPIPIPTSGISSAGQKGTTPEEYRRADEYLSEMANRTGGRVYKASNIGNLSTAFSNIASELREFYSLGYYPKEQTETGKKRRLKVRVDQQGLVVRARDSYVVGKKSEKVKE